MSGPAPDVSIIIPCYNRDNLISKTIQNALAQQGASIEIIIVDDGSDDGSWERIKAFGDSVRAFRQTNAGVSAARNAGIKYARGRYIKFLDSDDLLPTGALAGLLEAATSRGRSSTDIFFGDARLIDPDGLPIDGPRYGFPDAPAGAPLAWSSLLSGTLSAWLPLFPRDCLLDVGGFDESLQVSEDQELAVRLKRHGYQLIRIEHVVAQVREHDGMRLSRGDTVLRYANDLAFFEKAERLLRDAGSDVTQADWQALSGLAWIRGRDAARSRARGPADALFSFALRNGGKQVRPRHLSAVYAFMTPYDAECWIDRCKRWMR